MSHNLFEGRFYSNREPAWHGLGYVSQDDETLGQVVDRVGLPMVTKMPVYLHGKAGTLQVPDYRAIVGSFPGSHAGGQEIGGHTVYTYGMVQDDYTLITHKLACEVWEKATGNAVVETMGLLGHGETMFITTRLPSIDVKGDEVAAYLCLMNPLDGKTAVRAKTCTVRWVCQNTMNAGLAQASDLEFRGLHRTKGVVDNLTTWLTGVWAAQREKVAVLKEAFELLANSRVYGTDYVMNEVYPYPVAPAPEGFRSHDAYSEAMDKWNDVCLKEAEHRTGVRVLVEGSSFNTEATRGTLWGLYNAVVEYEDYGRPRTTAASRMFGVGAQRKQRAFDACMELTK